MPSQHVVQIRFVPKGKQVLHPITYSDQPITHALTYGFESYHLYMQLH